MSPLREKMITLMRVRHLSERTVESYQHAIEQLYAFYRRSPDQLSCDEVVRFLEDCVTNKKLSRATVNVYFCACRLLYEQVLEREPVVFTLPRRGRSKKRPQILSPEECLRLVNAPKNLKHRALLFMVYGSGLRVSEVVRLLPKHIESDRMMVFVQNGKGHKDRYTLLARSALAVLREYWKVYRPPHWLFYGRDPQQPMNVASAQQIYYQALSRAGVRRVGGIHTLRHCFATHHMENGLDPYVLQRLMGHSGIKTTAGYMHVREARMRQVISPLDMMIHT